MATRKNKKKKPDVDIPREISRIATDYLKDWTNREIQRIQVSNRNPICIPVKDGFKIGTYKITLHKNHTCDLHDFNSEYIHRFDNKVSAILYAVYTIKHKFHLADRILQWDNEINKNYTSSIFLRRTIAKGLASKDYFKVDMARARLELAEYKLQIARDNLLKMCKTAKYYKVWE